ncbi:hypothetical protein FCV25MIE_19357, partial [Fagus crenata]
MMIKELFCSSGHELCELQLWFLQEPIKQAFKVCLLSPNGGSDDMVNILNICIT